VQEKGFIHYTNTEALAFRKESLLLAMVPKLGGYVEDGGTGIGTKPI